MSKENLSDSMSLTDAELNMFSERFRNIFIQESKNPSNLPSLLFSINNQAICLDNSASVMMDQGHVSLAASYKEKAQAHRDLVGDIMNSNRAEGVLSIVRSQIADFTYINSPGYLVFSARDIR